MIIIDWEKAQKLLPNAKIEFLFYTLKVLTEDMAFSNECVNDMPKALQHVFNEYIEGKFKDDKVK